jgi:hypothetical protein
MVTSARCTGKNKRRFEDFSQNMYSQISGSATVKPPAAGWIGWFEPLMAAMFPNSRIVARSAATF